MVSKARYPIASVEWETRGNAMAADRVFTVRDREHRITWTGTDWTHAEFALGKALGRSVTMDETLDYMQRQGEERGFLVFHGE